MRATSLALGQASNATRSKVRRSHTSSLPHTFPPHQVPPVRAEGNALYELRIIVHVFAVQSCDLLARFQVPN